MPDTAPSSETLLLRQQLEQLRNTGHRVQKLRENWEALKERTKAAKEELDTELEVLAHQARQDAQAVVDFSDVEKGKE